MPDLDWNKGLWGGDYDWNAGGEEWSAPWGGSEPQWFGSLYPRLHRLLPARRILEIAPGYGRWTRFLLPACSYYFGVDLSEACVLACKTRFRDDTHAHFIRNDGLSLRSAPDKSFDLIFSFDSLVHAELDVLQAYIPQIIGKLSKGGVAFLHHSNLQGFENPGGIWDHSRAATVSARAVSDLVHGAGGKVFVQEIINWHSAGPIDCLTTFGSVEGHEDTKTISLVNMKFTDEAAMISTYQSPYCRIR